jgi:hypothetical protein
MEYSNNKANILTEVSRGSPHLFFMNFIPTLVNSLPRGVEPGDAGCYSGALTTRLEPLSQQ